MYSDMEAKFRERDEREEQLMKAKGKLENDIAEIMRMSGDNSSQLTKMNDELRLKERYGRASARACCRPGYGAGPGGGPRSSGLFLITSVWARIHHGPSDPCSIVGLWLTR